MQQVFALPFLLVTLDQQIKRHGGKGFNCEVKQRPIPGSFSVEYEFETENGRVCLISPNIFKLGVIHTDEGLKHICYYADTSEYFSVVVRSASKLEAGKLLVLTPLGKTYQDVINKLTSWYPEYQNLRLTQPTLY